MSRTPKVIPPGEFDPYHRWLGIPRGLRPPTHYELLGIAPDESDVEVIHAATLRQSAYVRNFQSGLHAETASRILSELAEARAVLTDPTRRKEYDGKFFGGVGRPIPRRETVQASDDSADLVGQRLQFSLPGRRAKRTSMTSFVLTGVAAIVIAVVAGGIVLSRSSRPTSQTQEAALDTTAQPPSPPTRPKGPPTPEPVEWLLTVKPAEASVVVVAGKATVSGAGERRTLRLVPTETGPVIAVQVEAKGYEPVKRSIRVGGPLAADVTTFNLEPRKIWISDLPVAVSKAEYAKQSPGQHSFSMHPPSRDEGYAFAAYDSSGYRTFHTRVALPPSATADCASPIVFAVFGDGKLLWASGEIRKRGDADECVCDVTGVSRLELRVRCDGDNTHARGAWIDPYLVACDAFVGAARAALTKRPLPGAVTTQSFWSSEIKPEPVAPTSWLKDVQRLEVHRLAHDNPNPKQVRWLTGNDVEAKKLPKEGYWRYEGFLGYSSGGMEPGTLGLWRQHDSRSNLCLYYLSDQPLNKQDGLLGYVWPKGWPGLIEVFVMQHPNGCMSMVTEPRMRDQALEQKCKLAFSFFLIHQYELGCVRFVQNPDLKSGKWDHVPNGDFEKGMGDWSDQYAGHKLGRFLAARAPVLSGTGATRSVPATDLNGPGFAWISEPLDVTPGQEYVLSAAFHTSSMSSGVLMVEVADRPINSLVVVVGKPNTEGWRFAWVRFTATEPEIRVRLVRAGMLDNPSRVGEAGYIDSVGITPLKRFVPPDAMPPNK